MKNKAFTLVELLVVCAIIGILAAMLVPTFSGAKNKVRISHAKWDIANLVTSIKSYENLYSRPPMSIENLNLAASSNSDFTYGNGLIPPFNVNSVVNNSEVMSITMDLEKFPNGNYTINTNHSKNPQRHPFFNGKIDDNGIFRDPWETPYIISLDTNFDDKTRDTFYSNPLISAPNLNGLFKTIENGLEFYEFQGNVMVWSFGPDKKISTNTPANKSFNKDNILSWK